MDPTIAALLGTLAGAVGSVAGVWLTQKAESRRDLMKASSDLGKLEFENDVQLAKEAGGGNVAPLSFYVRYHWEVLKAVQDGKLTSEEHARIRAAQAEMFEQLKQQGRAKA